MITNKIAYRKIIEAYNNDVITIVYNKLKDNIDTLFYTNIHLRQDINITSIKNSILIFYDSLIIDSKDKSILLGEMVHNILQQYNVKADWEFINDDPEKPFFILTYKLA